MRFLRTLSGSPLSPENVTAVVIYLFRNQSMFDGSTMFVGADVTHPPPGPSQRTDNSISAVSRDLSNPPSDIIVYRAEERTFCPGCGKLRPRRLQIPNAVRCTRFPGRKDLEYRENDQSVSVIFQGEERPIPDQNVLLSRRHIRRNVRSGNATLLTT